METELFNRQYIISIKELPLNEWKQFQFDAYHVYVHPNLEYVQKDGKYLSVAVLGYLFDYRNTDDTNEDIVQRLAETSNVETLLQELDLYCGQFIVLCKDTAGVKIIPDACAQRMLYYNDTVDVFASQVKLMERFFPLEDIVDQEAKVFFNSSIYKYRLYTVSDKTWKQGVFRLMANTYLDVAERKVVRFFPKAPVQRQTLEDVVEQVIPMFKGYIEAIAKRYKVAIPVTAGFDSRMVFASSLGLKECTYFIYKHPTFKENHPDLVIPKKLTELVGKPFHVLQYPIEVNPALKDAYKNSLDYARDRTATMILSGNRNYFKDSIMLNGNLGEIARSYYNYPDNVSGRELAALMECRDYPYAVRELQEWYDANRLLFKANNLSVLDMFFWELDWGPSSAQSKQECWIASEVCSPFNSRIMLTTLLRTDAKYRVKESCRVFREIINRFAGKRINLPVNPTKKHKIILAMKRMGIYLPYRKFRMNVR